MGVPEVHRRAEDRDRARVVLLEDDDRVCREHDIADSLLRKRQQLLVGAERVAGQELSGPESDERRRQISRLERALGRKTMEVEIAGNSRGWE